VVVDTHRIVLTIGLNPVPCLVAAHRLMVYYDRAERLDAPWPRLLLACSPRSLPHAEAIAKILRRKLGDSRVVREIPIEHPFVIDDVYDPEVLASAFKKIPSGLFHLHYTGGTSAMAVQATAELFQRGGRSTSYLDESRHRMLPSSLEFGSLPDDERPSWTGLTIDDLGFLHQIECHRKDFDFGLETAARSVVPALFQSFGDWIKRYQNKYGVNADQFEQPFPAYIPRDPESLSALPKAFVLALATVPQFKDLILLDNGYRIDFSKSTSPDTIAALNKYLNGGVLEVHCFDAMKIAFGKLGRPAQVYHSVQLHTGQARESWPELDVAAMYGYQLIAVSCSMTTHRKLCKMKAIEVLFRARQLGGEGARAVLVTTMDRGRAADLQADVREEFGVAEAITVWGLDHATTLAASFEKYLSQKLGIMPCQTTPAAV